MDGLETDSCDTVLQWTRLQGTNLLLEDPWFGCEANDLRSVDVTLPLTIRLITIRATDEPGTYDARASICTGISSKLHCSAVSLELDAAGVNSSLLPRIPHTGAPHYPYTTYPPPTTATSYSFLLLQLFSYRPYATSVSSALTILINPTSYTICLTQSN